MDSFFFFFGEMGKQMNVNNKNGLTHGSIEHTKAQWTLYASWIFVVHGWLMALCALTVLHSAQFIMLHANSDRTKLRKARETWIFIFGWLQKGRNIAINLAMPQSALDANGVWRDKDKATVNDANGLKHKDGLLWRRGTQIAYIFLWGFIDLYECEGKREEKDGDMGHSAMFFHIEMVVQTST